MAHDGEQPPDSDEAAVARQSAMEIAAREGIPYADAEERLRDLEGFDLMGALAAIAAGVDAETARAEATNTPGAELSLPPDGLLDKILEIFAADQAAEKARAGFTIIDGGVDDRKEP